MKQKVISRKNLPTKIPLVTILLAYLFLDKFNAPQWLWGVVITVLSICVIVCIVAMCNEESIDIKNLLK